MSCTLCGHPLDDHKVPSGEHMGVCECGCRQWVWFERWKLRNP